MSAIVHWGVCRWQSISGQDDCFPLKFGRVSDGVFRWSPELLMIAFDVGFWREFNDACDLALSLAETDILEASQCGQAARFVRSFADAFAIGRVSQFVGASWSGQSVTMAVSDFLLSLSSFAQFLDDASIADEDVEIRL